MGGTLHVAAMPFPTPQGTQAAVRAMLDVLAGIGRPTHLLCYARGAAPIEPAFELHRVRDLPGRDRFRSGPSLRKVAEDALLARALRGLRGRLAPDAVVAHHVEAAAACVAARVRPFVFVAHTDLGPELPTYAPRALAGVLSRAGNAVDRALSAKARAVAAIAPALRDVLEERTGREVRYLPVPWPVPPAAGTDERLAARARLSLSDADDVLLYAGNLDAYQGWELVVDALAVVATRRPRAKLLVATASDPEPLLSRARERGLVERVRLASLAGEAERRAVHAAADVALVPRRTPGGLPIKLLDALARGVPTVCAARATAGLDLRGAAMIATDDDADALASGALITLGAPDAARELGARGRAYVVIDHAPERFVAAFDSLL